VHFRSGQDHPSIHNPPFFVSIMVNCMLMDLGESSHEGIQAQVSSDHRVRSKLTLSSPYDVLDISYLALEADIKRHYRKKSLLIHPDKFKHEHGDEVRVLCLPLTRECADE